ncbi:hypothetical protein NUV89_17715 [Pseudomonas sp. 18.1.10]|uniref:hypothetical protein n=1 Tax=Pseudomonas sp. 18.1.10 TaxID=2969302 RepID=UPI0021501270|nr:hypothetical protein [Pseudomonas sp. 18.1.10]MCR4540228.1 hypothetical protein [Pseudomonas sp. 18.1.10]
MTRITHKRLRSGALFISMLGFLTVVTEAQAIIDFSQPNTFRSILNGRIQVNALANVINEGTFIGETSALNFPTAFKAQDKSQAGGGLMNPSLSELRDF